LFTQKLLLGYSTNMVCIHIGPALHDRVGEKRWDQPIRAGSRFASAQM